MAGFYPLLAKAVSALDGNTREARRILYERARAALIAEMRRADPALNQSGMLVAGSAVEEASGNVEAAARYDVPAHQPIATTSNSSPHRGESPGKTDSR